MAKILLRLTDEIQEATARREETARQGEKGGRRGWSRSPEVSKTDFAQQCLPHLRDEDAADIKLFIRVCLEEADYSNIGNFVVPILTQKDLINWKTRDDMIQDMLKTICLHGSKSVYRNSDRDYSSRKFREALIQIIKDNGLYPKVTTHLYDVIYTGTEVYTGRGKRELPIVEFAQKLMSTFPWRDHPQEAINILDLITKKVEENPTANVWNICTEAVREIGQEQGVQFQMDIIEAMCKLFKICMNSPWYREDGERSYTSKIIEEIMNHYLYRGCSVKKLAPFIEDVKKIWYMNEKHLGSYAESVINNSCSHFELMGEKTTEKLIDLVLTGENTKFLFNLSTMYPKCPQYFHKQFDEFIYAMKVANSSDQGSIMNLLWNIAKLHPEEYSHKAISAIAEMLVENEDNLHIVFHIFNALAEHDPSEVFCHVDKLKQTIDNMGDNGFSGILIFLPLSRGDGDRAYVCLEYLASKVDTFSSTYRPSLIYYLRSIGTEWPHLLAEYEGLFVKLSRAPALRDACKSALDIIQGRSLEAVTNVVTEQQSNIEDLDFRLAITGDNLENIATEMDARPKVKPPKSIQDEDEEKGTSELLRLILEKLEKLTVLDEMTETISSIDLRVGKMDKRLKSVERQVIGLAAQISSDV